MKQYIQNLIKPIVLLALLALLAGLWAGLVRIGWRWPAIRPALPMSHGPLMVSGFFGTLILLERAVALKQRWAYFGPVLCGIGGLMIWTANASTVGRIFIALGSLWLVLIFVFILRQIFALYTITMTAGAICWLLGNLFWLFGRPVPEVVLWWVGFLVLTIAGERLELSRVTRPTLLAQRLFLLTEGVIFIGLLILPFAFNLGVRIFGIGLVLLASWLLYFDIARRTVRMQGLPRFIAFSLLAGYIWMAVSGILLVAFGAQTSGPRYDAMLHAVFVGFVVSMVFGHAPMIFPAVLQVSFTYNAGFYLPLALLHGSLLTRILADLAGWSSIRLYSGLTNALAILIYAGIVASSMLRK